MRLSSSTPLAAALLASLLLLVTLSSGGCSADDRASEHRHIEALPCAPGTVCSLLVRTGISHSTCLCNQGLPKHRLPLTEHVQ